jgi:hypothetical protein
LQNMSKLGIAKVLNVFVVGFQIVADPKFVGQPAMPGGQFPVPAM